MRYFFLSLTLMAGIGIASLAWADKSDAAKNFVDGLATQVLAIVKSDAQAQPVKQAKIEAMFSDKVDINFVAKFVLGKHWRTATPQQQQRYVAAYKPFILKNYASKLTKYSGQTYSLKNSRTDEDATVVTMEINDPAGQNILVDYRLRGEARGFKIVDITVEGVSLLATQRAEFNSIVDNKGVDGLIEALKTQVASK